MKKEVKDEQELEYSEKLKIIDDELMSLYQFCVQVSNLYSCLFHMNYDQIALKF